ncbi:transposase of ISEc13 [Escherichia coli]|nr:transposase of ISEc13 [Escherichia coli]
MAERLGEIQKRIITVCDREADIWHYLHYKVSHGQRFVVRAAQNRRQEEAPGKLFEWPEVLATAGSHTLNVMQKGGRAARQARMFISYSEVSIKNPDNSGQALPLTYVCCGSRQRTVPAGIC